MTLPVRKILIDLWQVVGTVLPDAQVRFTLTRADIYAPEGLIVPAGSTLVDCDVNGQGEVSLFPNVLGQEGTHYVVEVFNSDGLKVFPEGDRVVPAVVPDAVDTPLSTILFAIPPIALLDVPEWVQKGKDWATKLVDPVETSPEALYSSRYYAEQAGADAFSALGAADAAEGDRVLAQAAAGDAQGSAVAAAEDAALAEGFAAEAQAAALGSDLGAADYAALHRSPNPVTATALYDTTRDSDGGAWRKRCEGMSWYSEALCRVWLGQHANEAAARLVAGATTDDFFQNSTDGKHYKLNAGAGVTEVFRGNTREFPTVVGIVGEANRVVLYALDQPGRPMWMVFHVPGGSNLLGAIRGSVAGVAMQQGQMFVAQGGALGLSWIDFSRDRADLILLAGTHRPYNIALRNARPTPWGSTLASSPAIINATVNAVAMATLSDAPVDPLTGLQAPTIAVATAGGVTIIKHDGSVVNGAAATDYKQVALSKRGDLLLGRGSASSSVSYARTVNTLAAGFAVSSYFWNVVPGLTSLDWQTADLAAGPGSMFGVAYVAPMLTLVRENPATPAGGLVANIAASYNTGWMAGDIRRCILADVTPGPVVTTDLITNGDFASAAGWTTGSGWVIGGGVASNADAVGGSMRRAPNVPFAVGDVVVLTFTLTAHTAGLVYAYVGGVYAAVAKGGVGTHTIAVPVTALGDGQIGLTCGNGPSGISVDNLSAFIAVKDRSYKGKPITPVGPGLVRTAVAVGAQLVAYSGFGAASYLREAWSADLDFGVGSWSVLAWVNVAAGASIQMIAERYNGVGVPYLQLYADATGKLVVQSVDQVGATRTATSPAAYSGTGWLLVEGNYQSNGTLTLRVNGKQVAQTTGAALGSVSSPGANAYLTVGNNANGIYPFLGSIALVRIGATVPTAEQALFMFEQERPMFRDGAQVTLPDTGAPVALDYDESTGIWSPVSAANESRFSGLVRVLSRAANAGSYIKAATRSGMRLLARSTVSPGVDVVMPALALREELMRRSEEAARLRAVQRPFDFDATAAQTDFALPTGWEAVEVLSAGASTREGAAKDWTRKFDGFKETTAFAVGRALNTWVQILARRST